MYLKTLFSLKISYILIFYTYQFSDLSRFQWIKDDVLHIMVRMTSVIIKILSEYELTKKKLNSQIPFGKTESKIEWNFSDDRS